MAKQVKMFGRMQEWTRQEQMDFAHQFFTDHAKERKMKRTNSLRKGTGRIEISKSKVLRIKDLRPKSKKRSA